MYSAFISKYYGITNFYRICLDPHQMDVKSLIQGTLSPSQDDLWAVVLYTITNDACQSGTERKRLKQETDRWIERGRGEAEGSYLERIPKHVQDDSGFSRPDVGRYVDWGCVWPQVLRKLPTTLKMGSLEVSSEYIAGFQRAINTFLYQLCYDPRKRKLVPLTPYPPDVDPRELEYAGPYPYSRHTLSWLWSMYDLRCVFVGPGVSNLQVFFWYPRTESTLITYMLKLRDSWS